MSLHKHHVDWRRASLLALWLLVAIARAPTEATSSSSSNNNRRAKCGDHAQPINDLATGAVCMHASLYAEDARVRCPAYAFLFKLIKGGANAGITRDVAEAIAILTTSAERQFHEKLFLAQSACVAAPLLLEAAQSLDASIGARLDLIRCLQAYAPNDALASAWLAQQHIDGLENSDNSPDSERPPSGLVAGLVGKFDSADLVGDRTQGPQLNALAFRRARELIETLEDDETRAARVAFDESHGELPARDSLCGATDAVATTTTQAPVESEQELQRKRERRNIVRNKLSILRFIRMRLEMKPTARFQRLPKVSIQLASDWAAHWNDLEEYLGAIGEDLHASQAAANNEQERKLDQNLRAFLTNERNVQLNERLAEALDAYGELDAQVQFMTQPTLQFDANGNVVPGSANKRRVYESIEQFNDEYEQLNEALKHMDERFDVSDAQRVFELYSQKHVEYNALNSFIEQGFGRRR